MEPVSQATKANHSKILLPALLLASVVGLGILGTHWHTGMVDAQMRAQLLQEVMKVAGAVNPDLVKRLTFTPADNGSPAHERLRDQMTAFAHFMEQGSIYSLALRDGNLIFGPVGHAGDDTTGTPPGTLYEKATPDHHRAFEQGKPVTLGPTTEKEGAFVSALAPVLDPRSGKVLMVIGMDIPATDWKASLSIARLWPVLITSFFLLSVLFGAVGLHWRGRLSRERAHFLRYLEAAMVAVLGLSLTAVAMLSAIQVECAEHRRIFFDHSDARAKAIQSVIHGIRADLQSVARFCAATPNLQQQQFAAFAGPLARTSAIHGYQWLEYTSTGAEKRYFTNGIDFPLSCATPRPGANGEAQGNGTHRESICTAALDKALATGFWTASNPDAMRFNSHEEPGMLVLIPVFTHGDPSDHVSPPKDENPYRALRGFAAGMVRLQSILQVALTRFATEASLSRVSLLDFTSPREPMLLAGRPYDSAHPAHIVPMDRTLFVGNPLTQAFPLFAFGRAFVVTFQPSPTFYDSYPRRAPWVMGIAGFLTTCVLTVFVAFLCRRQAQLEQQVEESTAAFRQSKEQFRRLFENALNGAALCDIVLDDRGTPVDYVYIHANAAFETHTGLHVPDILGKRATQTRRGMENTCLIPRLGEVVQTGKSVTFDLFFEPAQRHYNFHVYPVDKNRFCMLLFNTTEQKLAQDEARNLAERLQHYAAVSPVISYALKMEGESRQPLWVSENIRTIMGFTPEEAMEPGWWIEQMHPEDREQVPERMARLFQDGQLVHEYRFHHKAGSVLWLRDRMRIAQQENDVREVVGTWANITHTRQAEEEFKKLEAQFHQAQKMDAVGRLAGGVAHDFNNMLAVILGFTETALMEVDAQQPIHWYLQEVKTAAERSDALVSQLLAFARKQTVKPVVLNLNDAVTNVLKMLRRLIGEDIDLAWLPGRDLRRVKIDPAQIDQILTNLSVNARDAIHGVGTITIQTSNVTLDEAQCGDSPCTPGEYVLLTFTDNGCGMDYETLNNIFEPFFTTKEVGKGTGLGLSTVYGIVRQNGGHISVSSRPGQGTRFDIYLPCHLEDFQDQEEFSPEPIVGGKDCVLVVEDELSILRLTKLMLEKHGYRVLTAITPCEAIRLAEKYAGEIDLIITDVIMPEMNGRELARRLLSNQPRLKCLFMSGYTADTIARHGVLDEGLYFIKKPFSAKELTAKVRQVIEAESVLFPTS